MTKLNWIELRKAVAAHLGTSERETAAFMNALITQIQLGLKNERQVRITGLGTFRLQEVSPRKSVDVTTGQPIVLPGYNKIVFIPEIGVKELIQTGGPVSHEEEDTPLQRLGKQADEIVAIIQRDINTTKPEDEDSQSSDTKTAKAYHFTRDLLITLSVIILLLLGCYLALRTGIRSWIDNKMHQVEQTITPTEKQETKNEKQETRTEKQDTIALEVNQVEDILTPRVYTEFIATETVGKGSRLAYLARKYYGQTDLWVFIYEANRDQFPNPNDIKAGDKLRIPKLSTELQDLSNPANRQLVDQLLEEYTK